MHTKGIDRDLNKHCISDAVDDDINKEPTSRDAKEDKEGKRSHESNETALIDNLYVMGQIC